MRRTLNWEAKNIGTEPSVAASWNDVIALAHEPRGAGMVLAETVVEEVLYPGESYERSIKITLPNGIAGSYYIQIYADYHAFYAWIYVI